MKSSFARRSGEISRTSISSRPRRSSTARHSVMLPELIVAASSPSAAAIAIWFRIRASSGLTIRVGPWPVIAPDAGRDPVDEALAPAGPLDDEGPRAVLEHRLDRLPLPVAKRRVGTEHRPKVVEEGVLVLDQIQAPSVRIGGSVSGRCATYGVTVQLRWRSAWPLVERIRACREPAKCASLSINWLIGAANCSASARSSLTSSRIRGSEPA